MGYAIETPGFQGPVIEKIEGKRPFGTVREQPRMEDLHPGEDKGRHLPLSAPGEQAQRVHAEISPAAVAFGPHHRLEQQQRVHALGIPGNRKPVQRGLRPVEPQHVAINDEKGLLPHLSQSVADATPGLQKRFLEQNRHRRLFPLFQMGRYLFAQVKGINHHPADSSPFHMIEDMIEQGHAPHLHQWFGGFVGDGAHAVALAGGENHGRLRHGVL